MHISFDQRTVLVTGASTGIGAAVARAFGAAGARVTVHYNRSAEAAEAVVADIKDAGGEGTLAQADLARPGEAARLVGEVAGGGSLDVLVNNAGGLVRRSEIADLTDELYDAVMDLNVRAVAEACRAAIPVMRRQGHGNIVNVTSIAARTGGAGGSVLYAASKAAVATLTRGLAKELVGDGIRVNALSPGIIETPFHERFTAPEQYEALVRTIPMGRAGRPDECAGPVLFLASEQLSSYVTGQILEVNGGQLAP